MKTKLQMLFAVIVIVCLIGTSSTAWGQSYLGLDGGFEGTATIDNSTTYTSAQTSKWTKTNTTQTIAIENSTVRSGIHSLRVNNTGSTGRRVWSPLISITAPNSQVTIQYYRYVGDINNSQESISLVSDGGTTNEKLASSYSTCSTAGIWEKVTFNTYTTGTYFTYSTISGGIMHRILGTGGDMYIDDMCIYTGDVDKTAPSAPTSPALTPVSASQMNVQWTDPVTGIDGGGYMVVRGISAPTTTPNINGIYTIGNFIAPGEIVVYLGTNSSFTDNGLTPNTQYYYRIYTVDKAFNYSTPATPAPVVTLPVEMTSFTASMQSANSAMLKWSTATEVNNSGFEIERRSTNGEQSTVNSWQKVGFVAGAGTSNSQKEYTYQDVNLAPGVYVYRIKQIDNNGAFKYSASTQVDAGVAGKNFELLRNYPNPFNPTTNMQFSVPQDGYASLKVYNMLGQEIATLFDGMAQAGHYIPATFDGSRFASGIYFSRLQYNGKSLVQRMLMTK